MSEQTVCAAASFSLTRRVNLLVALVTPVAGRPWALLVITFVDLGIGITKLDGDIPNQLVLETNGLHTRDSLDNSRLSVGDMADGANVDCGLPCDNFGCQGRECLDIEVFWVGLGGKYRPLNGGRRRALLHGRLERLVGLFMVGVILVLDTVLRLVVRVGIRLDVVAKLIAVGSHDCGDGDVAG